MRSSEHSAAPLPWDESIEEGVGCGIDPAIPELSASRLTQDNVICGYVHLTEIDVSKSTSMHDGCKTLRQASNNITATVYKLELSCSVNCCLWRNPRGRHKKAKFERNK